MAVVPRSIGYQDTIPDLYNAGVLQKGPLAATSDDDLDKLVGKPKLEDMLARMAVTFAEYGKSSSRPQSLLGAIGAALGGGTLDRNKGSGEDLKQLLQVQQLKKLRSDYALARLSDPVIAAYLEKLRAKLAGGGATGPSTASPSTAAPGTTPGDPAAGAAPAAGTAPAGLPSSFDMGPPRGVPMPAAGLPLTTPRPGSPGETIGGPVTPPPNRAALDPTANYGGGVPDDLPQPDAGSDPTAGLLALLQQQGGPAAGSTPGRFRSGDDSRYAAMVDPATDRSGNADSSDPLSLIAHFESGGRNIPQQAVPQSVSSASGPWQMLDSTFHEAANKAGIDVSQYRKAMDAPIETQKAVAQALFNQQGYRPWAPYNPRLAAAIGAGRGASAVSEGVGDLVGSGGPSVDPDIANLKGLLALRGMTGGGTDPLAGLLGAGGGDDGGSLPGDLVSGLGRPSGSSDATELRGAPAERPDIMPSAAGSSLAAYATGNAKPGGASSVEGLNSGFAGAIGRMVADMPPEIRQKFEIISGHRSLERQMQVNPSAPNSRHIPGFAADLGKAPDVLAWIRENGSKYDVGFPLLGMKGEENHMEYMPGGYRTGGGATRLPRSATEGVSDLPDVRGLLGGPDPADAMDPELKGLLTIAGLRRGTGNQDYSFLDDIANQMTGDDPGGGDTGGGPLVSGLPSRTGSGATPVPTAPAPSGAPPATPSAVPGGPYIPGQMYVPPPAPRSPSTPAVIPELGISPQELGTLDALMKMRGINSPFKELLDLYYKSPDYLREAERARSEGGEDVKRREIALQNYLDTYKEVTGKGWAIDKNGRVVDNGAAALAGMEAQEKEKARADAQIRIDKAQKDLELRNKGVAEGPDGSFSTVPGAPAALSAPDVEKARGEAAAKQDYEWMPNGGVLVQDKEGRTFRIPMTQGDYKRFTAPQTSGPPPALPGGLQIVGEPFQTKSEETRSTELTKYGVEELKAANAAAQAATRSQARLGPLAEAGMRFQTGPGEETWTDFKAAMRHAGLIKGADVPDREIFRTMTSALQTAAAPKGQGAVSDYERTLFAKQVANMSLSRDGLMRAISIANALDKYDLAVARIHREVAAGPGGPNALEAQRRIEALGPPLTPEQYSALETASAQGSAPLPPQNQPRGSGRRNPYGTVTPQ